MSAPSSSVFPQWAVQSSIVKEYQRSLAGLGIEDLGNVHFYLDRITYLLWKALGEDLVEIARVAAVLGGGSKINTESYFSLQIREGDKGKDPIGSVIAEIERRASVARGREREKMLNVELRQSRNDCRVQFMAKENEEINKEGFDVTITWSQYASTSTICQRSCNQQTTITPRNFKRCCEDFFS